MVISPFAWPDFLSPLDKPFTQQNIRGARPSFPRKLLNSVCLSESLFKEKINRDLSDNTLVRASPLQTSKKWLESSAKRKVVR